MREVHFCTTCDFRLPYCVRTDRRFCGQQCRLWWYRHPGQKRPDFSPGGGGPLQPLKKGQPMTLAQALAALAEARAYAAQLEAEVQKQQVQDHKRRDSLSALAHALSEARSHARHEQEALRDELEAGKQRLAEAAQKAQSATAQAQDLREQAADLTERLQQAEKTTTAHQATSERAQQELTKLQARLDTHERTLAERDGELKQQRQHIAAAERAHQEIHVVAQSDSRSLRTEKARRIAAEQRIEQLTRDLEQLAREQQTPASGDAHLPLFQLRDNLLAAELQEVRLHRDEAVAERELLTARILQLMAPGQYLEHAAAAGYDLTQDPLIRLKREEVVIEDRLAAWQATHRKRRRARRRDPEQTLDEQAYAAALSSRWKQVDHPHVRRKQLPRWRYIGFLLDTESEEYLLTLTRERIAEMKRKMEART